ncbi:MAG: hypothetical protein R3C99_18525, partial [Pirellulaceae bacterium]
GGDWITATATEDLGGGLYGGTSEFSMAVQAVEASIITVDTTAHTRDGDTSSIAALFADRGADGRISLREAIEAANNTANVGGGPDLIRFDLSTSDSGFVDPDGIVGNADDYWRIQPTSQFTITDAVVIDGFSQAGSMMGDLWAGTPHEIKVEIDGSQTNTRGFVISSAGSGSTIRGLAIHSAMTNNIQVNGQSTIEANYVGLTANGDDAPGHRGTATTSANILVNGSVSAGSQLLDNVVAGAWNKNIRIGTANGANGVIVQGNFVGVDPTGMSRAPGAQTTNGTYGIILRDGVDDVVIGGSNPGEGNLIGGVYIAIGVNENNLRTVVQGNYVGVDRLGTGAIENALGVYVGGGSGQAMIGGVNPGEGNLIANNGSAAGVMIQTGTGTAVLGNRIFDNDGLAIDLHDGTWGVTANDAGDADGGVNDLQNFPTLTSVSSHDGDTYLLGQLNSDANSTYRIELFSSPTADASGHGEARTYLGAIHVTTDADGNADFHAALTGVSVAAGHVVSATATMELSGGGFGGTSEFGPAATVAASMSPTIDGLNGDAIVFVEQDASRLIRRATRTSPTSIPRILLAAA